jgi:hypothetical protein
MGHMAELLTGVRPLDAVQEMVRREGALYRLQALHSVAATVVTTSVLASTRELVVVGVLDRQTYQGGTRGSRLCGDDRDRLTENSKVCARTRDTRFIQVRVAKVASPTSCLGDQVWRPALGVGRPRRDWGCAARYPALLYIVQGAGS